MLYAESSAVLAWLRGEDAAERIARALGSASHVLTSELTLLEVERVLVRAQATGVLSARDVRHASDRLRSAATYWMIVGLHGAVLERAGRPFPAEPVRTLDALHLATVLETRRAGPTVTVLSLDRRIRENAMALGLEVRPG